MKRRSFLGAIGALLVAPWRVLAGKAEPANPGVTGVIYYFGVWIVHLADLTSFEYDEESDETCEYHWEPIERDAEMTLGYLNPVGSKSGRHLPEYAEWLIENIDPMSQHGGDMLIWDVPKPIHFSSDALADSVFNEVNQ